MSKLLINEPPLQVLPSLAARIGLNEAIILQQIHYWLSPRLNKNAFQGRLWVHNKYEEWQQQFPFWSLITIRRTMKALEKKGFISCRLEKKRFGQVKFYTINYDTLSEMTCDSLTSEGQLCVASQSSDQSDLLVRSHRASPPIKMITPPDQNDHPIYKDTETTSETILSEKTYDKEREILLTMLSMWNSTVVKIGGSANTLRLTPQRAKSLKKALETHFLGEVNAWQAFCEKIASSKFLMGEVTAFKASLEWCLKEDKLTRILEGDYGVGDRTVSFQEKLLVDQEPESLPMSKNSKEEKAYHSFQDNELWSKVKRYLKEKLGDRCYLSWIKSIIPAEISMHRVVLKTPSKFAKDYISTNLLQTIKEAFLCNGTDAEIEIRNFA